MEINIPGRRIIKIENLLLDYNGTIACDRKLISSVQEKLEAINKKGITVQVVTGTVRAQCANLPVEIKIFDNSNAAENKRAIVEELGADRCLCIGNGFNDGQMFETCSIAIIVIGEEGCSAKSLLKADIVCKNIEEAFDLILKPSRMIATLRG